MYLENKKLMFKHCHFCCNEDGAHILMNLLQKYIFYSLMDKPY